MLLVLFPSEPKENVWQNMIGAAYYFFYESLLDTWHNQIKSISGCKDVKKKVGGLPSSLLYLVD